LHDAFAGVLLDLGHVVEQVDPSRGLRATRGAVMVSSDVLEIREVSEKEHLEFKHRCVAGHGLDEELAKWWKEKASDLPSSAETIASARPPTTLPSMLTLLLRRHAVSEADVSRARCYRARRSRDVTGRILLFRRCERGCQT
jgi:hypothetical protein